MSRTLINHIKVGTYYDFCRHDFYYERPEQTMTFFIMNFVTSKKSKSHSVFKGRATSHHSHDQSHVVCLEVVTSVHDNPRVTSSSLSKIRAS